MIDVCIKAEKFIAWFYLYYYELSRLCSQINDDDDDDDDIPIYPRRYKPTPLTRYLTTS